MQQRPGLVTAIAVINFVVGGLKLLGLICGSLALLVGYYLLQNLPAPPNQPNPMKEIGGLLDSIPGYVPVLIVSAALSLVMTIVLLVSGFGLLRLRNWARILCFVYAIYIILSVVAGTVYQFAVVKPATEKWAADLQKRMQEQAKKQPGQPAPPAPAAPGSNPAGDAGGLAVELLEVLHGVALLVVLNLGDVRRAFAGLPPRDDYGRDRDEGWPRDRPPRERFPDEDEGRGWRPPEDDRIAPGDR